MKAPLRAAAVFVFLLLPCVLARAQAPAISQPPALLSYAVSLARRSEHLVHIRMQLPAGAPENTVQLPVWNALYQVRDFCQYVRDVAARDMQGRALLVRKLDKTTWRVAGTENGATFEYDMFADIAGPYGAQLNDEHAFFNLAEILMYLPEKRTAPVVISFSDLPALWHIATALPLSAPRTQNGSPTFSAGSYDQLVDSPFEISSFEQTSFHLSGAEYRIVIHADPADYNLESIREMVEKIVSAEVVWMNDRPFKSYLFIYHFPHIYSDGGMEHAYSTAIDEDMERMKSDPLSLAGVTAHEFFHLWNVKRIRPQSLEPIDYTRENYTTALWFSEGFTSTVDAYMLMRAGLTDSKIYLRHLAEQIRLLEKRPAHRTQSAEESSLDAWLEKYPHYRLPDRSISYYDKGEIVGVLLDLTVRQASGGKASLRDVMQWMNQYYAKQGQFFPDTAGVEQAAEAVSGTKLNDFFRDYVAGTREIPYDDFFRTAGLKLVRRKITVADPGFVAVQNFHSIPVVGEVKPGSPAYAAGLHDGDIVVAINGKAPSAYFDSQLEALEPGATLQLRLMTSHGERDLQWKIGFKEEEDFTIEEIPGATPEQIARRAAWLAGEDQPPAARKIAKPAEAAGDGTSSQP